MIFQGYRTHDPRTGKPYRIIVNMYKTWIMQRISTALMQGMAACIHERLHRSDRTAPDFRDLTHRRGHVQGWYRAGQAVGCLGLVAAGAVQVVYPSFGVQYPPGVSPQSVRASYTACL